MGSHQHIYNRGQKKNPFSSLKENVWKIIFLKLVLYTSQKVKKYKWRTCNPKFTPSGTPEDIVLEAIEKTLSRKRDWDNRKRDLLSHLKGTIDSLLYNLVNSYENKKIISYSDESDIPNESISTVETPENHYLANELFLKFLTSIDGNVRMKEVLNCLINGISKPLLISEKTGLNIREVYKSKERLCKIARSLF